MELIKGGKMDNDVRTVTVSDIDGGGGCVLRTDSELSGKGIQG